MLKKNRARQPIGWRWDRLFFSLLSIVCLLAFVRVAQAAKPVEGVHFTKRGDDTVFVRDSRFDVDQFARLFDTTPFDIRELNPTFTLAVCMTPKRWLYDQTIRSIEDRASNKVWDNCPQEQRRVDIVPGSVIFIPSKSSKKSDVSTPEKPQEPIVSPAPSVDTSPQQMPSSPIPAPSPSVSVAVPSGANTRRNEDGVESDEAVLKGALEAERAKRQQLEMEFDALVSTQASSQSKGWGSVLFTGAFVVSVVLAALFFVLYLRVQPHATKRVSDAVAAMTAAMIERDKVAQERTALAQERDASHAMYARLKADYDIRGKEFDELLSNQRRGTAELTQVKSASSSQALRLQELERTFHEERNVFLGTLRAILGTIQDPTELSESELPSVNSEKVLARIASFSRAVQTSVEQASLLMKGEEGFIPTTHPLDVNPILQLTSAYTRLKETLVTWAEAVRHRDDIIREQENSLQSHLAANTAQRDRINELSQEIIRLEAIVQGVEAISELRPGQDHVDIFQGLVEEEAATLTSAMGSPPTIGEAIDRHFDELISSPQKHPSDSGVRAYPSNGDNGNGASRKQTLPHGLAHATDLLRPDSRDRENFFNHLMTLAEVVRETQGALRLMSVFEIQTLHDLASMRVEAKVVRRNGALDQASLTVSEFGDPRFVSSLRPCAA